MTDMQTDVISNAQAGDKRFATRMQVVLASFIGGPFASSYLIGKNYKNIGNKQRAKQWYAAGVVLSVLLFTVIMLLPEQLVNSIPHALIPILYTAIFDTIFKQLQDQFVKQQLAEGKAKYSWGKVLGVSVLSLAVCFLYVMIVASAITYYQ